MPTVRQCPHCLKRMIWSTYQLIQHVEQCPKKKSVTVTVNFNKKHKYNSNTLLPMIIKKNKII